MVPPPWHRPPKRDSIPASAPAPSGLPSSSLCLWLPEERWSLCSAGSGTAAAALAAGCFLHLPAPAVSPHLTVLPSHFFLSHTKYLHASRNVIKWDWCPSQELRGSACAQDQVCTCQALPGPCRREGEEWEKGLHAPGWEAASRGSTKFLQPWSESTKAQHDTMGTHICHNRHQHIGETEENPPQQTGWSWLPDPKQASAAQNGWVWFCLCVFHIIASWNGYVQLRTSSILYLQQMVKTSWHRQVIHSVLQTRSPVPGRASGLLVHLWGTLVETHSQPKSSLWPHVHTGAPVSQARGDADSNSPRALWPDFKQLQWIAFALNFRPFILGEQNTSMSCSIMLNAGGADDRMPGIFWKMASESLGMQVASVSSSWAVLFGFCSPIAVRMDLGWCFAAQWQQQNCFKIKAPATGLVRNVPSQAGASGLGRSSAHLRHFAVSYVRQKVFALGEKHSIFTWLYGFYLPVKALTAEKDVRLLSKTVWTSKQMFFPACRNVTCPVDWSLFGETMSQLVFWLFPEKAAACLSVFSCLKRPMQDWVIRKSKL